MAGERTEEATPRRLQELRERGRVLKSADVVLAAELLVAVLLLQAVGGEAILRLRSFMTDRFADLARPDLSDATLADLGLLSVVVGLTVLAPLFVVLPVVAVAANVGQMGGINLASKALMPDLNRINPLAGFKRLGSARSLFELVKSLVKVGVAALLIWTGLTENLVGLLALAAIDLRAAVPELGGVLLKLALNAGLGLLALSAVDYMYQRWDYLREARMTREELKQELRQSEGDPQIKLRIRQVQRAQARRRMMAEVPNATVVVTNPTHLAVALAYRADEMDAPKVVAKGADLIALKIRELAREHDVPVVENKPLAQALYRTVDLDQEIPAELFQAVAEVLAYIYTLGANRGPWPVDRPAATRTGADAGSLAGIHGPQSTVRGPNHSDDQGAMP